MKTTLVTGAAGFIGSRVCEMLLEQGNTVVGVDNLNNYYDVTLKTWRLNNLNKYAKFKFYQTDIEHFDALDLIFKSHNPDAVINEAARAGVRYSLKNPFIYMSSNANGNLNLLELCRRYEVPKFVLASTSSLYAGQEMPFKESLPVNKPVSPYAASKKAAEAMAYTYHYLYGLDITVLRYFTVYGPAGRPDMSVLRFVKWVMEGKPVKIFGDGNQIRDFTYIDDIARGTVRALKLLGYEIINLGNNKPDKLIKLIHLIESFTGKSAGLNYQEAHKADMTATWANIEKASNLLNWEPLVDLDEGIKRTVEWCRENWGWLQDLQVE